MPTLKLPSARKGLPALVLDGRRPPGCRLPWRPTRIRDEILRPAESLEGNFLSAYVAGSARDTEAATIFFREAIQEDPRNQELLERAFVAFLANGSMPEAIRAAERLSARDRRTTWPSSPSSVRALKEQKYADARARLPRASAAARRT